MQSNKVTVDLSNMTAVVLDTRTNWATIQAGAKLGPVYKVPPERLLPAACKMQQNSRGYSMTACQQHKFDCCPNSNAAA